MVSSVSPNAGITPRTVDPWAQRAAPQTQSEQPSADRVDVSAAFNASRESVKSGVTSLHQALALVHDAQSTLVRARELLRADAGAQGELTRLLEDYQARLEIALNQGARVAAGADVVIDAEPGTAPLVIGGVDLRLGGAVIEIEANARADDSSLGDALQRSMERLQEAMNRLLDSVRALEAHHGFLSAAAGASKSVRHDLDADGARLLALQAKQGLEAAQGMSIANVEPQAVLAHFRA